MRWITMLCLILVMFAQVLLGATVELNCGVGGAKLEKYNFATRQWQTLSGFPCRLMNVPLYGMVQIRVTSPGYEDFKACYDVNTTGTMRVVVQMELADVTGDFASLFNVSGQVTRRDGTPIAAGDYTVKSYNLRTYRTPEGAGQFGQDSNPILDQGGFSNTLGNDFTSPAILVGDRIFTGVYTNNMTRCLGYVIRRVTLDDIQYGGFAADDGLPIKIMIP